MFFFLSIPCHLVDDVIPFNTSGYFCRSISLSLSYLSLLLLVCARALISLPTLLEHSFYIRVIHSDLKTIPSEVYFKIRLPLCARVLLSEPMEIKKNKQPSSGYGKPPWIFRGSALYQLHLVKAETARPFIPKEFKLVEAFGYTLGGFFLANYEDSPAGTFDELVVIAGLVWNPPTSCAWAARVLVDSKEACSHGRKEVGLPSQVARFSKKYTAISKTPKNGFNGFLGMIGMKMFSFGQRNSMDLHVSEIEGQRTMGICNISLCTAASEPISKWKGPLIRMSLPSFSGRTEDNPHLLKYACHIECRVQAVSPAKVSGPSTFSLDDEKSSEHQVSSTGEAREHERNLSISVMLSKPILALQFSSLKMKVEAPAVISEHKQNTLKSY